MRFILCAAGALCLSATAAISAPITNGVTPDYFNGTGVANGDFTGVQANGIEVGLRGRLRYDTNGDPQNTWDYDGDHTYSVYPAQSNPPADRSAFNWDWSINVDFDGSTGSVLSDFTYVMQIDRDPSVQTDFHIFDPINSSYEDHEIGNNASTNGQTAPSGDTAAYQTLLDTFSIAQNSWNRGFFPLGGNDPTAEGLYTISLSVFSLDGTTELASTSIDIRYGNVPPVPLPATLPLLAAALGGVGFISRRRKS